MRHFLVIMGELWRRHSTSRPTSGRISWTAYISLEPGLHIDALMIQCHVQCGRLTRTSSSGTGIMLNRIAERGMRVRMRPDVSKPRSLTG